MDLEYLIFSIVRLGFLLFSFFALPSGLLMLKTSWQINDQKKIRRGISLVWGAILTGCIFVKMFGGMSCIG